MSGIDASHYDSAALDRLRRFGGDTLLRNLVAIFATESARRLAQAQAALGTGDGSDITAAAHALKSSSAQLGAVHLSSLCAAAERAGAAGDIDAARDIIAQVSSSLAEFSLWVATVLPPVSAA